MGSLFPLSPIYSFYSSVRSFLSLLNFSYFFFHRLPLHFFSRALPSHSIPQTLILPLFVTFLLHSPMSFCFSLDFSFYTCCVIFCPLASRIFSFSCFFFFHIVQTHLPSWFLLICLGAQVCSSFITSTNTAVA